MIRLFLVDISREQKFLPLARDNYDYLLLRALCQHNIDPENVNQAGRRIVTPLTLDAVCRIVTVFSAIAAALTGAK